MLYISIFLFLSGALSQVFPEDFKEKVPSSTVPGGKKAAIVLRNDFEFAFEKNPSRALQALTKRSIVGTRSPEFKLDVFSQAQKHIYSRTLEKRVVAGIGESGLGVSGTIAAEKETIRRISTKHSIDRRSLPPYLKDFGASLDIGEVTTLNLRNGRILTNNEEEGDAHEYAGKHIWIRKRSETTGSFVQSKEQTPLQQHQQQDGTLDKSHTKRSLSPASTANGNTISLGNSRETDQLNGLPSDQADKHVSIRKRSFDPSRRFLVEVANKHAIFTRSNDVEGPKLGTIGRVRGIDKRSLSPRPVENIDLDLGSTHDFSGKHVLIRKRTFGRDDIRDGILTERDLEKEKEMSTDFRSRIHQLS